MFGDDRLRGLGVAGGQILAFPIDFDCRPYNTLALPCECVTSCNSAALLRCLWCGYFFTESVARLWRQCKQTWRMTLSFELNAALVSMVRLTTVIYHLTDSSFI